MITVPVDPQPVPEIDIFDLDGAEPPPRPEFRRCNAVTSIDRGAWIGTLVCCTRHEGHDGEHSIALGDNGAPDFWQESWR